MKDVNGKFKMINMMMSNANKKQYKWIMYNIIIKINEEGSMMKDEKGWKMWRKPKNNKEGQ